MIPLGMIEDRVEKIAGDVMHTYAREGVTELRLLCVLKVGGTLCKILSMHLSILT
jgi:hypothetical protein